MTKQEILEVLLLLSALESWSFADKHHLPDYLFERLDRAIANMTEKLLGDEAEKQPGVE